MALNTHLVCLGLYNKIRDTKIYVEPAVSTINREEPLNLCPQIKVGIRNTKAQGKS